MKTKKRPVVYATMKEYKRAIAKAQKEYWRGVAKKDAPE